MYRFWRRRNLTPQKSPSSKVGHQFSIRMIMTFPFRSFMRYPVEHLRRNSISASAHVIIFSIFNINDNIQFETRRKDSHVLIVFPFHPGRSKDDLQKKKAGTYAFNHLVNICSEGQRKNTISAMAIAYKV